VRLSVGAFAALFAGVSVAASLSLALLSGVAEADHPLPRGVSVSYRVAGSDFRRSSLELSKPGADFRALEDGGGALPQPFGYLWIDLRNTRDADVQLVLSNSDRNYYTELLEPHRSGAVALYRQGDTVPVSDTPLRYYRTAFPLSVPAGGRASFVVEFHGPRGVSISPWIAESSAWFARAASRNGLFGVASGAVLVLLVLEIATGFLFAGRIDSAFVFFASSVFFFFLRQSRLLLFVLDPLTYPDWLFPVSIALNLSSATLLILSVFGRWVSAPQRRAAFAFMSAAAVCAAVSLFAVPYLVADILNSLSALLLLFAAAVGIQAFRAGARREFLYASSFLPWVSVMIRDIAVGLLSLPRSEYEDYLQVFGLIAALSLASIASRFNRIRSLERRVSDSADETRRLRIDVREQYASLSAVRENLIGRLRQRLRRPLEAIAASAVMLERECADPRTAGVCALIVEEADTLRRELNDAAGRSVLPAPEERRRYRALPVPAPGGKSLGRVHILDSDGRGASSEAMILRSVGYEVLTHADRYLALAAAADADVLLVDPSRAGDGAFSLCGLVRERFNLLALPILMIADFDAEHLMMKGYAAGVNDFLTRPFEAAELTARVRSLVRLKGIVLHNQELSRSEKEKNAFLYFMTHNVNTPLTLLINRVRELEDSFRPEDLPEIIDDLRSSSDEISDIVRNVLVSFRIADGRQTVLTGELDFAPTLEAVVAELGKKAAAKGQRLEYRAPETLPALRGDGISLRGVVYNMLDNAIKFSPRGGAIRVSVLVGADVSIAVEDSGPGIPAADRDRLFKRFERLTPQPTGGETSTGLGLFVAAELARLNGGTLRLEDGEPGARFVLALPIPEEEEPISV